MCIMETTEGIILTGYRTARNSDGGHWIGSQYRIRCTPSTIESAPNKRNIQPITYSQSSGSQNIAQIRPSNEKLDIFVIDWRETSNRKTVFTDRP